jgi:Transposase DDE domain
MPGSLDWYAETSCLWMERSLRQMLPRRAVFRGNSWQKLRRLIELCASIWLNLKRRIRWRSRLTIKIRYPRPIRTPPMRPRVARLHAWVTTTIIWSIITAASLWACRLQVHAWSEESRAAQDMIARFAQWQGRKPESIAADASYGNGEFLQWLMDREITPYMPTRDAVGRTRSPFYGPERFTYQPESNSYICPAGQQLNYGGRNQGNRTFGYIGTRKKCGPCQQRSQCTSGPFRYLAIHMNEAARQRARDLWTTPEFEQAQRQRKKIEALFAQMKNHIGLHRLRLRRLKFVREQFFLAATAQNIKRLVRFLSHPTTSLAPATA